MRLKTEDLDSFEYAEIGAQFSTDALQEGLSRREAVIYTYNGNRMTAAPRFLKRLQELAPRFGVTSVMDISYPELPQYAVFQSNRPSIYSHTLFGQKTQAHGKGPTTTQAKISCLMEAMELFCAEPRHCLITRGSYDFLRKQHYIADPRSFVTRFSSSMASQKEPLAWTRAYSLTTGREILIPAETAYFPFFPENYRTRYIYPQNTNGLASGASYLEAVIHGIYEIIERHYVACLASGNGTTEALFENELKSPHFHRFLKAAKSRFEVQIYALELQRKPNLPVIFCLLVGDDFYAPGWGCSMDLDISISRAVSEAWQSLSVRMRELGRQIQVAQVRPRDQFSGKLPSERSLRPKTYLKRILARDFLTLDQELKAVLKWLKTIGFPEVYVANFTRHGIGLPVVKVVIPGMDIPDYMKKGHSTKPVSPYEAQYPIRKN